MLQPLKSWNVRWSWTYISSFQPGNLFFISLKILEVLFRYTLFKWHFSSENKVHENAPRATHLFPLTITYISKTCLLLILLTTRISWGNHKVRRTHSKVDPIVPIWPPESIISLCRKVVREKSTYNNDTFQTWGIIQTIFWRHYSYVFYSQL